MEPIFLPAEESNVLRVALKADGEQRWQIFKHGLHRRVIFPRNGDSGPFRLVEFMTSLGAEIRLPCVGMKRSAEALIRSQFASVLADLVIIQGE